MEKNNNNSGSTCQFKSIYITISYFKSINTLFTIVTQNYNIIIFIQNPIIKPIQPEQRLKSSHTIRPQNYLKTLSVKVISSNPQSRFYTNRHPNIN